MKIALIAAIAENNVIGKDNQLLWKLSADMKLFRTYTTGHHVIMGRKTFDSLGKPLPNRTNIIVTRQMDYMVEGAETCNSLAEAIDIAEDGQETEAFVIGGAEIYRLAMYMADVLYISHVHASPEGDAFFPIIDPTVWELKEKTHYAKDEKNQYDFDFCVYHRIK